MASAVRCHLGSTVAWNGLASQILVNELSPQESSFNVGTGSTVVTRHKAIVSIAYDLASKIVSQAREQLALVPAPYTPPDSLAAAGIVDGDLFPPELISSCLPALVDREVQHFDNWNRNWDSFDESPTTDLAAVLMHALTHPINPYTHFKTLGFLAQRAETDLLPLLEIPYKRGARVLRSADEIFEFSMTISYAPTSGHYNLYWRQGAIGRYIDLTLRYYIYLNLLIAVDSNDALRNGLAQKLTDFPGRDGFCSLSRPDDLPIVNDPDDEEEPLLLPEHDALHHPFWAINGDRDAERTQAYLQRCFDIIVAWYALMETASDRNRAIGDFEWPRISFDDVVGGILEAFKSFGNTFALPPFKYPLGEFLKEHVNDFAYPEPQFLTHVDAIMTEPPNWKINLTDLPSELLDAIASLLPPASLVSLSQVSRNMRMHSIKSLFADPFGRSDSPRRRKGPTMIDALFSSSDLREAVGRGVFHTGEPRAGTSGHYSHYLTVRQGIELFSPLALQLPNLRKMDLVIQSTQLWDKAGTNNFYPLLQTAQSRWPSLLYINIIYHQVNAKNWRTLSQPQKDQAMQQCPGEAGLTWKLESISFERYLDAEFEAHTDTPGEYLDDHIPLIPLLSSSVKTLRTLSLSTCKKDIGNVSSFPLCPYVTKLAITSNFTSLEISRFLSKFPALRDLEVSVSDWAQEGERWPSSVPPIDFAKVAPGLRSLAVAFYDIASIPDSCVRLSGVGEINPEIIASGPFPFVQKKTKVVKELILVGYRETPLEETMSRLALAHPSVVYLEIQQHFYDFHDEDDLVVTAILENFLRLETLVLPQGLKRYPRRSDIPSGTFDRQDEKEKKKVLKLFKKSKTLKVVALRGIPSDHDDPYQVSKKVWVRIADGGARMAGREAIPVTN